jgi:23S rRNA pseudouridine2605 synthase
MRKPPAEPSGRVRLNKVIADSGYCARRKADELIAAGQVQVNGQTVQTLGTKIDPALDRVTIEGKPLPQSQKLYGVFHKPVGYITSRKAGRNQKTIYELLPEDWQTADPAGRLDQDSSGLLILSNDGDFLHQITHPRFHLSKVYEVQVASTLSSSDMERLKAGIVLQPENKLAKMSRIAPLRRSKNSYTATLVTGYNRQIRRSMEALGNRVLRLKRIAFGPLRLGSLPEGQLRPLTEQEIILLTSPPGPPPEKGQRRSQKKDGQVKHKRQDKAKQQTEAQR